MAETKAPSSPVIPHLTVRDGNAAIAFYQKAFGATLNQKMPAQDGKRLMHAALTINGGLVMLADEFSEYGENASKAPPTLGGSPVTVHLEVDDADRWWKRATEAGASIIMPIDNMFWGARYGVITDPFGHRWSLGGPLK